MRGSHPRVAPPGSANAATKNHKMPQLHSAKLEDGSMGHHTPPPSPPASEHKLVTTNSHVEVVGISHILDRRLRKLYGNVVREQTLRPHFRSLPQVLFWPNLEVTFLVTFSPGLLQCSAAVLGATFAGYDTTSHSLGIALIAILFVALFYAWQLHRFIAFIVYHKHICWHPVEEPNGKDEVDDPCFALLANITRGFFRPASRELGSFEPPDEDTEEPERTERALARFFSFFPMKINHMCAGDALSELSTWLDDSSGGARGIWYLFGIMFIQLITALLLGLTYSFGWSQSSTGSKALLGCLIFLQLLMAWWSIFRTANDKIDGVEKFFVSLCEATSLCLLLAANILADSSEGEESDLHRLERSLALVVISGQFLMAAVFFPMATTVYNTFIVPAVGFVWKADLDAREILCQVAMTCILLPCEIAISFFGTRGSAAANIVGELEKTAVQTASRYSGIMQRFDADSSGLVGFEEFAKVVGEVGIRVARVHLLKVFQEVDINGSGAVDPGELDHVLQRGAHKSPTAVETTADLQDMMDDLRFNMMGNLALLGGLETWVHVVDIDGNHMIDKDEFAKMGRQVEPTATREVCDAVFNGYDLDGSQHIEYDELILAMLRDSLARASDELSTRLIQHQVTPKVKSKTDAKGTRWTHPTSHGGGAVDGAELEGCVCDHTDFPVSESEVGDSQKQRAALSKGASKRLRREAFLECVRSRHRL